MAWYTRRQLVLLLALLAAGAVGLGVRQWRSAFPELAGQLERLDRHPGVLEAPSAPALERRRERAPRERDAAGHAPLDINRATAMDLRRLPGVGPALAARIVQSRRAGGPFGSVDDLGRVKGLGPVRLRRLRRLVTVSE